MLREFRADLDRHRRQGAKWKDILANPAVWALAWYRFGHWACKGRPWAPVRPVAKLIHFLGYKFFEVVMEMHLDPSAEIGPGLLLSHSGALHINPDAVIGRNCDIAHQVTIGASALGRAGCPRLGDNVYVGTGATLIGNIKVGDGAKIAANTLVITNVPPGATMMGVPGRVVMKAAALPEEAREEASIRG